LIALAAGAWWTLISPILMSVLLMQVSGESLLEKSLKKNRRGYDGNVARTSSFFPWPPRRTLS
jgi:steroid 5-alpha reductase family enzyme